MYYFVIHFVKYIACDLVMGIIIPRSSSTSLAIPALNARKTYSAKFVNRRLQCLKNDTELTLTDRTSVCKVCGMVKNRDRNAAENLYRAGLARIYACGHDGSVSEPRVHGATRMDEAGSQRDAMITMAYS